MFGQGPSTSSGIHSTLLLGREVIILGRDHADDDPDNNWVAVLYDGDVHWIWQHGVQLPDGVFVDRLDATGPKA